MATEEFVEIPTGGQHAFGVLHHSAEPDPELGLVYCAPFAEEQKSAYRVFVEFARRAAAKGIASLRFDYRGTGDSDGNFQDFTLEDWVDDTAAAVVCLKRKTRVGRIGIVGVRLGGMIAVQTARRIGDVSLLALWQPILDGSQFHRLEMRRFLIRQMMTKGKATRGTEDLAAEARDKSVVDMDGYLMRTELTDGIKATNLAKEEFELKARTLLFQISHTEKVAPQYEAFAERHRETTDLEALVSEPFWNRVGFVDNAPLFERTEDWLLAGG